jgi:Protein of unknown function (DUF2508).
MDKKLEVQHLLGNKKYTKEQMHVIEALEESRKQIHSARELFDNVNDPKLIDYAIYLEDAAKARYIYLLSEAKRLNVKVDCRITLNIANAV